MRIEKSCGAIVYRKQEGEFEFLAVKSRNAGHWSFPKGHVEEGETEEETAKREVFEEAGLVINLVEGFRRVVEYTLSSGTPKEVVYFIGEAEGHEVTIQEEEIQDYRWSNYNEMINFLTFDNNKGILTEAVKYLEAENW